MHYSNMEDVGGEIERILHHTLHSYRESSTMDYRLAHLTVPHAPKNTANNAKSRAIPNPMAGQTEWSIQMIVY